jgi:hypothetical protein
VISCETHVGIASFSEIFHWMITARRTRQLLRLSDSRCLPAIRGRNWNRKNYERHSTQRCRNCALGRRESTSFTSQDFGAAAKSARPCKFQTETCGLSCTGLENVSGSLFRNGDPLTSSEASELETQSEKAWQPMASLVGGTSHLRLRTYCGVLCSEYRGLNLHQAK